MVLLETPFEVVLLEPVEIEPALQIGGISIDILRLGFDQGGVVGADQLDFESIDDGAGYLVL